MLFKKEGQLIPVTQKIILQAGSSESDNPIVNAITDFLQDMIPSSTYQGYMSLLDEHITLYCKERNDRVAKLWTTTKLEDWLRNYFAGEKVYPFTLKIFYQRDPDTDKGEDDRLWIGIAEDDQGVSGAELSLAGMERRVTRKHIDDSIRGDCKYCAVANVLSELFPKYEVNVNGSEAVIHSQGNEKIALLLSERLSDWIDAYDNENEVGVFTLIIKTLEDNQYYNYLLDIRDLTKQELDLSQRISKLCVLSSEIEHNASARIQQEYEDLFSDTVYNYGREHSRTDTQANL